MSSPGRDPPHAEKPQPGWIAVEVYEELPELALMTLEVAARPAARSPQGLKQRLRALSDRVRGAQAIGLRQHPIAVAHRVFFRQIGLDPDGRRTPIEQAMLERVLHGGFRSRTLVDDALLISVVETGIGVWALDAGTLDGPLGVRLARAGELLGHGGEGLGLAEGPVADTKAPLPEGRLVVADAQAPLAELFGPIADGHRVGPRTRRVALFAVQVAGVPTIHVEEALWICRSALGEG